MRCDDGHYYVVKFQNNPQGARILANEMLAGRLALALGLCPCEREEWGKSEKRWKTRPASGVGLVIGWPPR